MLAGDRDRERATAALQEHYVGGRLTLEALGPHQTCSDGPFARRDSARSRTRPSSRLPASSRSWTVARLVRRSGAMLVVFTAAYLVFSFVLLLVFGLTLASQRRLGTASIGFLLVHGCPTYLLVRGSCTGSH